MTTAERFVLASVRPSFVLNWPQHARVNWGARKSKGNVYRFPDGSAITFTPSSLPVVYIGH